MSKLLIQKYLNHLQDLRKVSGSNRESALRDAFKNLLTSWGKEFDLIFSSEYEIITPGKDRRWVDGALLYALRIPFGYWEAKDEDDDLDEEIQKKFRRGYPQTNIIFEDTQTAVLIQDGLEIFRCRCEDVDNLDHLLRLFFEYERPEIAAFQKAVEQFQHDLPEVLLSLRGMIQGAEKGNESFGNAAKEFLKHIKTAINPALEELDVREMLIQHILTEEVFAAVFPNTPFHQENNVAKELYKLERTFFVGDTKYKTLKALAPYYAAIRGAASKIERHNEKQEFLKVIYENFYKVYNPKAADRLGVVYTPNEVVKFMIESADWLCEKHFERNLIDQDVEILDPATGTGTFICEILQHFKGQKEKLKYKYLNELNANELGILPYYVANLNIEATYSSLTGNYEEFPGLCFLDTLDNTFALREYEGQQTDIFSITDDNVKRIRLQNTKRISVIIGNPPYNANQLNENENNKNRSYPEIDRRIKNTYIFESTAQKTKLYDMYTRFFRWASDRLDDNGIIAFINNNSFINSRTFDGFRKCLLQDFNEIRIIDLKGNARTNGEHRRKEASNIFENKIRVGVAIWFCIRKKGVEGCKVFYHPCPDYLKSPDKLYFLTSTPIAERPFQTIKPDSKHNWINLSDENFDNMLPLGSKETKNSRNPQDERTIFKLFSLGVVTNRDEWVYGKSKAEVGSKIQFLIDYYNKDRVRLVGLEKGKKLADYLDYSVKWTRAVKKDLSRGVEYRFKKDHIVECLYRPFVKQYLYFDKQLNEMLYQTPLIFGENAEHQNSTIAISARTTFAVLGIDRLGDLHLVGDSQCFPRYRYLGGIPIDNITDWSLKQFQVQYNDFSITKDLIFYYVYGVLHDPSYQQKYILNLAKEFPHIPYYKDFFVWSGWGKQLMELHVGFEKNSPYPLQLKEFKTGSGENTNIPKCKCIAKKDLGMIILDTEQTLLGVPNEAWDYKIGSRSALEWILDQYKERKPKDPTIREKFDIYRFNQHRDKVIDLLKRVTQVSIQTVNIIEEMKKCER